MEKHEKNSTQQKYRIPKKESNTQSDDVHAQSPLSRITDIHQWDNPLQGWASSPRNKKFPQSWKRKRRSEKCYIDNEGSAFGRQPKVILTNVLKTEIGRKYIKTQLKTGANLSHGVKLQSDQQTSSSVETVEIWQIFNPLHQSLFISERQPKVILTNVLTTNKGRKHIQRDLLTDANISDASVLQSDKQTPSSDVCIESCPKINSPQSCIVPKRYGKFQKKTNAEKQSKDVESNDLLTVRRCDVILEDCSIKNRERDQPEKGRNDSKNPSSGLREASFQNSERRKTRGEVFASQRNLYSSEKSSLLSKEQRTEQIQTSDSTDSNENHESYMHNPQPTETGCSETFASIYQDPSFSYSDKTKSSPRGKQNSASSKDQQTVQLVSFTGKQEKTAASDKEPLNRHERNKERNDSVEPIVLSSDEETGPDSEDRRSYFRIGKKKNKLKSVQRLSVEPTKDIAESEMKLVSTEELKLHTSEHCNTFNEQKEPVLNIPFEVLYIGKYKGTATGCATFTTGFIKIPFEVDFKKKVELLVDSKHLRKFGLCANNSSLRSGTVIFLWLSSGYVEQIEKQIGTSKLNKQAKNTEFVFILLSQPLTEAEQAVMSKILVEISKRNSSPELSEYLLWEQVIQLLQELSCEECSFLDHNHETFQKLLQKATTSVLAECTPQVHQSSSNEPKSKSSPIKSSYTLLLKQNSGEYSFSITSAQKNEWKEVQEAGPVRNLIFYPPPPAKGGLGVTREDLECLEYGEFLNDVIIDFYLKYLLLEKAPKEIADRSHIFSSFFYKCLTRIEKNLEENPNLSIAQRRHRGVKRWTRHINIFTKDYIFVPVNEESHWYIAIICFPWLEEVIYEDCSNQDSLPTCSQESPHQLAIKRDVVKTKTVLVFNDAWSDKEELDRNSNLQPKENVQQTAVSPDLDPTTLKKSSSATKLRKVSKRSCILILDSLRACSVQNTVQVLREYLETEWEAKYKTHRQFNKSTVVEFYPRVPKQDNNSDCGVYLLQYVETFFQNPIVNFELPMHLERWFPRQVVRSKREEIRDLILQLHLQQQRGSKS